MITRAQPPIALLVSGPAAGGIRAHLRLLGRGLPTHGYAVRWATPAPILTDPDDPPDAWLRLPMTDRALSAVTPVVIGRLIAARRRGAAVMHAHGYKAGIAAALAAGMGRRAALIVTFHNLWPATAGAAERAALRFIARRATLVAVSEAIAGSLRAALPSGQVAVIGNGVEIERFRADDGRAVRAALGIDHGSVSVVGFFGRLTPEKGPDLALAAVARLYARRPDVRLLVVGDGPERPSLEKRAGAYARFLGQREDVPALMAACDVILIPSRSEGQSVVALEAMAAGKPIVAAAVGGLAALVGAAGGRLATPEDTEAFATALEELLADDAYRAALGEKGHAWVSRHGSAARMVAAVASLYDRLLSEDAR